MEFENHKKVVEVIRSGLDADPAPLGYEDSFEKRQTEELLKGQAATNARIDRLAAENRESGRRAFILAFLALLVAVLTLAATVYFGLAA